MGLFDGYETYHDDLPLLKKLGMKPFKGKVYEKIYVGKYTIEDGSWVKIWVEGAPAQFFNFEIYCSENKTTTIISTGSGCLSGYWLFVEQILENMVVIEKVKKEVK